MAFRFSFLGSAAAGVRENHELVTASICAAVLSAACSASPATIGSGNPSGWRRSWAPCSSRRWPTWRTPLYTGRLVDAVASGAAANEVREYAIAAFATLLALALGAIVFRYVAFMGIIDLTLKMMADIAAGRLPPRTALLHRLACQQHRRLDECEE